MKKTFMLMRIMPDGNTQPYVYHDYDTHEEAEEMMRKCVKHNPELKFYIQDVYSKALNNAKKK